MPHKHKRKRDEDDEKTYFNLAPSTHANSLPTYKVPSIFTEDKNGPSNKRRKANTGGAKSKVHDDTPKQFARMMAWQAAGKVPSGLDDGKTAKPVEKTNTTSKSKTPHNHSSAGQDTSSATNANSQSTPAESTTARSHHSKRTQPKPQDPSTSTSPPKIPTILPGESLSTFSARVDRSLPLSTVPRRTTNASMPDDIKPQMRLTKHNKRLQRMIADWRVEDAKIRAKREEQGDGGEDESISGISDDDNGGRKGPRGARRTGKRGEGRGEDDRGGEMSGRLWDDVKAARLDRKGKKKKKTLKGLDDPWKELERKRKRGAVGATPPKMSGRERGKTENGVKRRRKGGGLLVGVHDVVQAPPTELKRLDLQKLKGLV